jgi:Polyketide cyclase / dehydrase and lipid transport
MATVEESVLVTASLAEVWDHYFDARAWGAWVDGFQSPIEADGYPEAGGTLRWRSIPAGRGEVTERVLEHEHRRRHLIEFSDPEMEGRLDTRFEIAGEGTRVTQTLTYRLRAKGPMARLGALLFVKSQVRASVRRSLFAFKRAAEEAATLPA